MNKTAYLWASEFLLFKKYYHGDKIRDGWNKHVSLNKDRPT